MNSLLSLDPGAGALKICHGTRALQTPAIVAINGHSHISDLAGLTATQQPDVISTANGSFLVGLTAHQWGRPVENLDHDRFTGAPEMEALFCAAVSPLQPDNLRVSVVVGLPLQTLSADNAAETAEAVRKWLLGTHAWKINGQSYALQVAGVRVTSQPVGALMDFLLDENGHYLLDRRAIARKELGIVSIGMNSIELLAVENLKINQRFTVGRSSGVRRLLEILNPNELYSRGELDAQLRSGALAYADALPVWASEVSDVINKRWGDSWRRFASIIVVGGGAHLLRSQLERKFAGKAWFPDDPVLATARGLHKYGLRK